MYHDKIFDDLAESAWLLKYNLNMPNFVSIANWYMCATTGYIINGLILPTIISL